MTDAQLTQLFTGYGYKPYFVEGHEPEAMHQLMAHTLDTVIEEIHAIQSAARSGKSTGLPDWPMIIMRTPKGWTGPEICGRKTGRRYVARAPGSGYGFCVASRPSENSGRLDEELQAGGAFR